MPNFYKLNCSQQTFSFSKTVKLYRANLHDDSTLQFYALHDRRLHSYQYYDSTWQTLSVEDLDAQQLYFADVLGNRQDILIAKTGKGISFYQYSNGSFDLLAKSDDFDENEFHDVYDWNKPSNIIKPGHFYHDQSLVGILTKHQEYGIKFYAVMKDELFAGEYPIWPLDTDSSIFGNSSQADFFLSDLQRKGQENIIVRNRKGLNIYEFNQYNGIEHLMQVPHSAKRDDPEEKLFFPDLTGQSYQDIVLLNSSGLFVYQYNNEKKNYRFIHYNPLFAKLKGWNSKHINSVQFEDIDLDGRQDMLFTGPQGINLLSFNNYTNQWQPLLDNSQLTISERYSDIMKVIPANPPITEYPIIFTQHKNQLYWANIVEAEVLLEEEIEPQISNETLSQTSAVPVIPQLLKLQLEEEKPRLLLRDQLDCSSIINSVDKDTGKPKFKLPLIDLSNLSNNIKLDFFYDGNGKVSGILGFGWFLPQNFIMMDHQSSIFPEDEKYYVILQDLPQQLTFDFRNSTDTIYSFKLSNEQSDLRILYRKNEEKWEIDSKGIKQIYGRTHGSNTDPINWELTWENWRGVGSSSTGQKQLATAWYLAEVRDGNDNVMRYTYDIVNIPVSGGKNFTREIYLKTISDNQGNKIIFSYSDKDVSEYDLSPLVDQEGNLNTQAMQTRYLKGYAVTTPIYQQEINFVYRVESGKRFLTEIKQDGDVTNKSILQFIYKEISKSHMLEKVVLPTGANVEFSYESIGKISYVTEEIGRRFDVKKNYRVDYGNDDVLISYVNQQGQVALRMFNQEMTEELYSSVSNFALSRFPLLGRGSVKEYEVIRAEDFLAIVLYYHTDKELCLLRKEEDKWLSTPKYYNFNDDAIIRFGKDFIVVADANFSVELISWNKDSKKWRKDVPFAESGTNKEPLLLAAFGRGFIFYEKDLLSIGYKNREHQWQYHTIKAISGVIDDIKGTLGKFDLSSESRKLLLSFFKNTALQLNNNLCLLNRWKAEGEKLYSVIDLFVLDGNYKVAEHQTYKILQDDLTQFSHKVEDRNRNSFTLGYKKVDNKFKVIVKDFRGPILNEIYKQTDNQKWRNDAKDEVRKDVIKSLGKVFLLDHKKYSAVLNSQTAVCSNKKFTFIGDKWKVDTVSETELKQKERLSVPLGDRFILYKEDTQSSLKLYNQGNNKEKLGNSLLDLEIKQLNQTLAQNRYPVYLAYQENNKQVGVVEFSNDGSIDKNYKLPQEEKLSPWSSYQTLVTNVNNFDAEQSSTLVFRPQLGIRRLLPNPIIAKVTVSLNNGNKRITACEYSSAKALGNTIYYEKTSLIPGNDKASFGWIEEVTDFGNGSKVEKRVFNSQGKLIKTLKLKEEQASANDTIIDKENLYLNSTLLDKARKLEVAQFSPYEIADEEVGYYGFEDYEINRIGARNSTFEKRWLFNESDVVKQKFSFTGQNHLSLSGQKGSVLEGRFQPNNQNQEYVASCWVRPQSKIFELGAVTPYLKAIVYTESGDEIFGLLGEVKFQSSDWFYLEVGIDLFYAKQIYKSLNDGQANSTLTGQSDVNLKISILIVPGVNTTVDIDHIRFFPLNSNFQANVYDPKTKQVRGIIHANGLVKRYVYDKYQEQVASVNEYGQLEEFNTYTKASSIGRITQLRNNIQIQSENGFYEDFAPYSFYERWKIDNEDVWKISLGQLQHFTNHLHSLQLNPYDINSASHGMRMCFSLQSESSIIKFNDDLKLMRTGNRANIIFPGKRLSVPLNGEMLLAVEHGRLLVWIDGGLYFDGSSNGSLFNLGVSGKVRISDVMVFSKLSIQVTYFNALDEKLQEVVLEGENTAIVTEYLYDELGRQTITTQPARIERSSSQSVLAYYLNFVTNSNPYSANSVWKIGQLQGDVSRIIGEHSYSQTKYDNNPLDERCAVGLPGREFSVSGPYAKRFASSSENLFINNLFPTNQNYSYQVEYKPGGVEDISVFDNKNNRVAQYTRVPGSRDLLSTYEYDENDKLVKSLPPLYHEKVRTFHKLNSQLQSLSTEEKALQNFLGAHTSYDGKGNAIIKTTPDSGKVEHLYDNNGLLKFAVYYSQLNGEEVENVIYFDYDQLGRLISTGKLTSPPPKKEELLTLAISSNNTEEYQQFYHSDFEREPILRGKVKRTITFNNREPLIEESILNIDKETLSKRILIPIKDNDEPLLIAINKRYTAGKLREIEYPIDVQGNSFKLTYSYNKLGKVIGIGVPGKYNLFVNFAYNPAGQVIGEQHLPESTKNFTRQYSYNNPGFLTKLEDKFLTEKVYYTDGSYGGHGYGDGTITRTEFKVTWHEYCDNRGLGLNEQSFISENITPEESELCFHKLKETGYLNEHNHQAKAYYPALEPKLPIVCSYGITGRQIAKTLGEKGFPAEYGHSYDYGNHQELTKAKYFIGDEAPLPLQPDTFAKEIRGINSTVSQDIWQTLKSAGYLREDNAKIDTSLSHAKQGKSFVRSTLFSDLRSISTDYGRYRLPIERLLITAFSKKQSLPLLKSGLQDAFVKWNGGIITDQLQQTTSKIVKMLERKQYLDNPLNTEFNNLLRKYERFIPDIVRVLSERFARQLGEAEFDVESYDIDANGNHKHYYTGFDRYELSYRNNTNQVNGVKFKSYSSSKPEQEFAIRYDSRGNVIQALHKGIEHIDYNPASNRATKIQLTDGKTLTFYYNAQGERVLKRVADSQGQTTKEIHYIRDEFGRVLVERQITYIFQDLPPDILVTAYIYGPRGLLGFIRRDEFYSVITDHEGSVRLVVKGDEVVAAYDYLPYGNLMREYGANPEAHIAYRYTGQEWDEEIGLYNYHARFYDPSIGRFYQIDPKGQYFSPYKYAGNSPVSMIDPDGELAWFILVPLMIGLGMGGAYLGGSAANNNWNPGKWDYGSGRTWLGIAGGGVGGALLPVGFGASVGAFTGIGLSSTAGITATTGLGVGGVYLSTAATNNEWDPGKWDFSSPGTWNAAFQGFAIGSGAAGGIRSAGTFYKGLSSTWGKGAFIIGSTGTGGGLFVMNGFATNWDFSKPGVYFGFVDAITGAPDLPMFVRGSGRFLSKNVRNVVNALSHPEQILMRIDVLRSLRRLEDRQALHKVYAYLRNLASHSDYQFSKSLGKMAGGTAITGLSDYLMGMAASENNWDMTSFSTYHAIINGILTGSQLSSIGRSVYRKHKTINKIKPIKEATTVAEEAIRLYRDLLKEVKISYDPGAEKKFSNIVKMHLKKGNIPNTAISVVRTTDKIALVALSGNYGPGLVFSIDLRGKGKSLVVLDDNLLIGGRKVALSDDREINDGIIKAIQDKKEEIKEINIDEYKKEEKKLREFLFRESQLIPSLTEDGIESIITNLKNEIKNQGYMEERYAAIILRGPLEEALNELKSLDGLNRKIKALKPDNEKVITAFEEKITKLGQQHEQGKKQNSGQTMSGKERIQILHQRVDKLQQKKKQILEDLKKFDKATNDRGQLPGPSTISDRSIIDILWNDHLKKFHDKFTHWDRTNCAEPHVITALSRSSEIFPSHLQISSDYNLKDIRYLATYKITYDNGLRELSYNSLSYTKDLPYLPYNRPELTYNDDLRELPYIKDLPYLPYNKDLPQLRAFPRCDHCVITTKPVKNVITDPHWSGKIDDLKYKLPSLDRKQDSYKQRLYFLIPYHDMTNRLVRVNATDNRNGTLSSRQRRSEINEQTRIEVIPNYRNNKDHRISTVDIVDTVDNNHAINVNKKITNSAARPPSWINDLFGWIKSSIGGLSYSQAALPEGTSSTTTKNSILQVNAPIDVNGTIMLLDVLVRKVTGQKYVSTVDQPISSLEAQGYALNITKGFEKVVEQAGLKSGVSMHRLNIDFVGIQKEVTGKIMSGKFNEISRILKLYIKKACLGEEAGKLSPKKFDKFIAQFNKDLLNQSIEQILHNRDGILEIDGVKKQQMSLEPQSYLSNASIQSHSKDKVSTCLSDIGVTKLGGNINR
ncbi:RHS repeat-associated core domain-containing protein [Wolbachia endosymbiont (group B) of Longitarsus flavicornis]|uniref:RHS repeat-associated core domain-containing protein n=1 Tax=Wolbachia endosymbiont (group B) of Longitarsus flavicornis TaxID=3066135 RepID=UPI003342C2EB